MVDRLRTPARGEIWLADLDTPVGSGPGYQRPVLVVSVDAFNRSAIRTVIVVAITSNLRLAVAPGNVELSRRQSSLRRDSVINVSQVLTIDKSLLERRLGGVRAQVLRRIEAGLKRSMGLDG